MKDYYILNEARDEMEKYLDEVLSAVYLQLVDVTQELEDDIVKWSLWRNQSSPGYLEIGLQLLKGDPNMRRIGKTDVYVVYRDIRRSSRIKESYSVELKVTTYGQAKLLRHEIERLSLNMFDNNIIGYHYPSLVPDSSDESADIIVEAAQDLFMKLRQIIGSIVLKNELIRGSYEEDDE